MPLVVGIFGIKDTAVGCIDQDGGTGRCRRWQSRKRGRKGEGRQSNQHGFSEASQDQSDMDQVRALTALPPW
jgi:hypothetical protein